MLVCHDVRANTGHLAAFVHCAGITWRGSMLEMADADYESIVSVNLGGSFVCLTTAARALVAQGMGGVIVAIT
jgi:3-oxoacyl-[acyl-carrier protein] reductase